MSKKSKHKRKANRNKPQMGPPAKTGAVSRSPVILSQQIPGDLGILNPQVAAFLRQQNPPRVPHEPSPNVHILIERLLRDHSPRYLYRGQVRHYPALIPSVYRRAMVEETATDPVIRIDPERFEATLSNRDRARIHMLDDMMKSFGPSIGNVLAQQYGLNSEALDVTSEVEIAAFFATRSYPTYQHFDGTDDNQSGVIYRFAVDEDWADIATLDEFYRLGLKHIQPFGNVAFLAFRKRRDLLAGTLEEIWQLLAKRGIIEAEVRTRDLFVNNVFYTQEICSAFRKLDFEVPYLENTRLTRQAGGSIRTVSRWIASISAELDVLSVKGHMPVFDPPFAIGEKLIAVNNIATYPGLEIFPFKHTPNAMVGLTPQQLWPGPETDWIYSYLLKFAEKSNSDYLKEEGVKASDFGRGIVNPGYQPPITLSD